MVEYKPVTTTIRTKIRVLSDVAQCSLVGKY